MASLILTEAVREVASRNPAAAGRRPLYRYALDAIRNGHLPVRREGRCLMVDSAHLPLLAELLELAPTEPDRAA